MALTVKLDIYEGPLDLLLHLIRKNEVDIYDIPISLITNQYLAYLELLESMSMEIAGEFLVMAATLTQIKSKLLLPNLNDEEASDEEDPRMAIVRPLLEHMRLKEAAEVLERRTMLNRDVFARETLPESLGVDLGEDMVEASLFDLIEAFRRIVSTNEYKTGIEIVAETKTIYERIREIMALLKAETQVSFEKLCETDRLKAELILSFLAVLELARVGCLRLYQHRTTKELTVFYINDAPLLENNEVGRGFDKDAEYGDLTSPLMAFQKSDKD